MIEAYSVFSETPRWCSNVFVHPNMLQTFNSIQPDDIVVNSWATHSHFGPQERPGYFKVFMWAALIIISE